MKLLPLILLFLSCSNPQKQQPQTYTISELDLTEYEEEPLYPEDTINTDILGNKPN